MARWLHSAPLQQLLRECAESEQMAKGVFNIHSAERGRSGSERPSHRFSRMFPQSDRALYAYDLGADQLVHTYLHEGFVPLTGLKGPYAAVSRYLTLTHIFNFTTSLYITVSFRRYM